jgi:hypothetical protein
VTVIHSIANAQSRVATLHLIIHELLVFLVVPVDTAMPAPHGIGERIGRGADVTVAHRTRLSQAIYFGSSTSCGSSPAAYTGLYSPVHRPHFLTHPPSLSLAVYFLCCPTRAFNHEITILSCPSSTLSGSCAPQRDVSGTGPTSKGWLVSTEP